MQWQRWRTFFCSWPEMVPGLTQGVVRLLTDSV
jgi:hypothetical protein